MVRIASCLSAIMVGVMFQATFALSASDENQNRSQTVGPGQPNQQEQQRTDEEPLKIGTDLVVLDVTVLDSGSRPVMDLKQTQFRVFEDNSPQKIDFFSRDQVPVSLVFAIDTSGSMRRKLDTVVKASINLVKASRTGDELAVIEFKDEPNLLEEFTQQTDDIIYALQNLVTSSQTAMFDALYLAADYASKEGKNRRKAVILVTDGLDNNSYYRFDELVKHLQETDAQVYLIGFINESDKGGGIFKTSDSEKAERVLTRLASESGGRAFFPREIGEMHSIAEAISSDLRTQYSIGYYPTNSRRDGTYRSVKVQVNDGDRRLVARTRTGYTAPRESDSHPKTRN